MLGFKYSRKSVGLTGITQTASKPSISMIRASNLYNSKVYSRHKNKDPNTKSRKYSSRNAAQQIENQKHIAKG